MDKPSKNWQAVRQATLDRARRRAIEPLVPLYTIYACVCMCYLAGFLRFQFFEISTEFQWITALQLLIVVISGALVPVLTGSVLATHFSDSRLQKLADE